ncbi:MAG TPA: DUF411 domain-containing protein [Allocoleopsis sp.]
MTKQLTKQLIKQLTLGLAMLALVLLLTGIPRQAVLAEDLNIMVYRDPGCSCCGGWIDHLAEQGFDPGNISTSDMAAVKQQYQVPEALASCHTAVINGYVIEGHVPVDDIKRLLNEKPSVLGIAVPGMPIGTPGMESNGQREPFTVYSFDDQGKQEVFNQYSF